MNKFHQPILLEEAINYLNIKKGCQYIDATVGGGGHTLEILKKGGIVLGIDQDNEALNYVKNHIPKNFKNQLVLVKGNFKEIKRIAYLNNFNKVLGILFDLGVSNYQLKSPKRGFSFKEKGPLDMRMDREGYKKTAFEIINFESYEKLYQIFIKFGEVANASAIANAIVTARRLKKIQTTTDLAEIIKNCYQEQKYKSKIHPATKVFQAIRIAVNSELDALKNGLIDAIELLDKGGRLVVISYHSLEDRITKLTIKNKNLKILTKKAVLPGWEEVRLNPSARSAKLRAAEKI